MSLALSTTTTNSYIAKFEKAFAQATKPIEWIVIADDDPRMLRAFGSALDEESAAVLQLPQSEWNFTSKEFVEAIVWSLQQGSIAHLALVGSSHSQLPSQAVSATTLQHARKESNYEKLLEGVRRNQLRNRELQDRFADHVQQLFEIPLLNHRWSSEQLSVYGLLYRADSGNFIAYDSRGDSFVPIAG